MKFENFTLTARDGLKINAGCWIPDETKAIFCIVHGIGEHLKRYSEMAEFLCSNGYAVFSFDHRGHGLSEGLRGHSPSYPLLLDDVENIMKYARSQYPELPLILYGHSWGGNLVANFILKRKTKEIFGAILSAPWLSLVTKLSPLHLSIAKIFNKFLPAILQDNKVVPEFLSKDTEVIKDYIQDPLVHRKISIGTFFQAFEQGIWALENAHKLKIPTLVMHGTQDMITSWETSKEFADNAGNYASFKTWEGVKHEPHHDLEKHNVLNYIANWSDKLIQSSKLNINSR